MNHESIELPPDKSANLRRVTAGKQWQFSRVRSVIKCIANGRPWGESLETEWRLVDLPVENEGLPLRCNGFLLSKEVQRTGKNRVCRGKIKAGLQGVSSTVQALTNQLITGAFMAESILSPVTHKTCSKCKESKGFDHYHAKPAGTHGVHSICKPCRSRQARAWQKENPDRVREIQRDAKRRIRTTEEGRKHLSSLNGEYSRRNREKVNAAQLKNKRKDPLTALKYRYRSLATRSISRGGFSKTSLSQQILGCTWTEFKAHIERQFVGGMSWDVFSQIHIDHIVPLAAATTEDDLLALCRFTNLRPIWGIENLKKGAKREFLL